MLDLREFKNVPIPCYIVTNSGEIARLSRIITGPTMYGTEELYDILGRGNSVEISAGHISGPDNSIDMCWFFNTAHENGFIFGREIFDDEWCRGRDIVGVILEEDWKGPDNMNVRILRPGGIYD